MFVYFDQNISSSIQLIKNNEKINIKIKDESKINKSLINKLSKHLLKSSIPLNFISKKFYFGEVTIWAVSFIILLTKQVFLRID